MAKGLLSAGKRFQGILLLHTKKPPGIHPPVR